MSIGSQSSSVTVLSEILHWSAKLPHWQQEALRLILDEGEVGQEHLELLVDRCQGARSTLGETDVTGSSTHSAGSTSHDVNVSVTLKELTNVQGVNVLCNEQTLSFGDSGLSVIFGYTGSGKSGYGRILRSACRARHVREPILGNVLEKDNEDPPSAEIIFSVDGVEQSPLQWIDGQDADELLKRVSFFDSKCARVHVGEKNNIPFTPYALDALEQLAVVCAKVKSSLEAQKQALVDQQPRFLSDNDTKPTTSVGKLLRSLSEKTKATTVRDICALSENESHRIKTLTSELQQDPIKVGTDKRARARQIDALNNLLQTAIETLNDAAIDTLKGIVTTYQERQAAADLAAKVSFNEEPFPEVGNAAWKQLWNAARTYSSSAAYKDKEFPVTEFGSRCVLCQQPLDEDAKDRLRRFEEYVRDTTSRSAANAKTTLDHSLERVQQQKGALRNKRCLDLLNELKLIAPESISVVRQTTAFLLKRIRRIESAVKNNDWTWSLEPFDHPEPLLVAVRTTLRKDADAVESTADPDKREKLTHQLHEFQDRVWLGTIEQDVLKEIQRRQNIAELDKQIRTCNTKAITDASKRLAKKHVSDALRRAFAREIKNLGEGVRNIEIELRLVEGQRGTTFYQVGLIGAHNADVTSVLSEGEHRCVALAGFMAELAMEDGKSAIVFDDPVTSLDHLWRESFARRVAQEAEHRQVIVFTHDVAFLNSLQEEAIKNDIPLHLQQVKMIARKAGIISDELPWVAQKTKQRLSDLEKRISPLRELFKERDEDKYAEAVGPYYSRLRATIERAIEDVFFDNIVQRHREQVVLNHDRIIRVCVIEKDDWEEVHKLYKRCCGITEAHDRGELRSHHGAPDPDMIKTDLEELSSIVADIRERRRNL